jgi:hypothetical protein
MMLLTPSGDSVQLPCRSPMLQTVDSWAGAQMDTSVPLVVAGQLQIRPLMMHTVLSYGKLEDDNRTLLNLVVVVRQLVPAIS